MTAQVILFSASTGVATLVGGTAAFRLRRRTYLALAVTSGVLLGVVCFDLLPELFELANRQGVDVQHGMAALVLGVLLRVTSARSTFTKLATEHRRAAALVEKRLYLGTAERVLPRVKRYVLDPARDSGLPIRIVQ